MKKGVVVLVVLVAILALFVFWGIGTYNNHNGRMLKMFTNVVLT
jgi:hypothetical protein